MWRAETVKHLLRPHTTQVAADNTIASPTSGHNRGPVPPSSPAESR